MPLDGKGPTAKGWMADEADALFALQRARRYLRFAWRWRQGPHIGHLTHSMCVANALTYHGAESPCIARHCLELMAAHLPAEFASDFSEMKRVIAFNDSLDTSHADVLQLFDETIADLQPVI